MKTKRIQSGNAQKDDNKTTPVLRIAETPKTDDSANEQTPEVIPSALNVDEEASKEEARAIIQNFAPSAEERIKRVKNFEILSERFGFLKDKADQLERFQMENAGTNAQLVLKNQSGFEFKVSNTNVIEKALAVVSNELTTMLNDTEREILDYVM